MQRIQSWFDQLTINRSSRRDARRRRNHSRHPDDDRRKEKKVPVRAASHSVARTRESRPLPVSLNFPPPPPVPVNGSFPRRTRIRTNPWIGDGKMWSSMTTSMTMGRSMPLPETSMPQSKPPSLCVISPDTSMCSSGYASHDSSPDTSMVWSNSGEWKTDWKHYDNMDNSNVYHELMVSTKMSESSCSLNNGRLSVGTTPSPKHEQARIESPIYAEPWTQYRNHLPTSRAAPMVLRNCVYRPVSPIYTQPYSESYQQPRPPRRKTQEIIDDEFQRNEFLHELDRQIMELQIRSEELREMVERARGNRKEFIIPKMECTFELAI
ncbi:unnamed protein product [Caenorhabditis bovis]|uniref:Uncharacterized protein n=1 Tax=Caenorhabditis bovis TaxID=2654633 RepID=A0A8S1ETX2_9PELO|nr:unnamed protein product [Caenorhabditis bovis]